MGGALKKLTTKKVNIDDLGRLKQSVGVGKIDSWVGRRRRSKKILNFLFQNKMWDLLWKSWGSREPYENQAPGTLI